MQLIMGGTFDPIHHGHLRTALELCDWLQLSQMRLIPAKVPVHRGETAVTAEHRLAMARLAVEGESRLLVDDCELTRSSASYSVLTAEHFRQQMSPHQPLCLVMGADAFAGFSRWYQWQRLLELCHILVVNRPGHPLRLDNTLKAVMEERQVFDPQALQQQAAGCILQHELTPLEISATQIRQLIASGRSPRYLLPEQVWNYIKHYQLYGYTPN